MEMTYSQCDAAVRKSFDMHDSLNVKVKVKMSLCSTKFHASLTSALDEGKWSA
jgi:hypothetical protein